mgnify:CR=1 FL=1
MSSGHLRRFFCFPCTSPLRCDVQGYGEIGVLADTLCLFFDVLSDTRWLFLVSGAGLFMEVGKVQGGLMIVCGGRDGKSMSSGHLRRFFVFPCTSPLRSDVQGYEEIGVLADTLCLFSVSYRMPFIAITVSCYCRFCHDYHHLMSNKKSMKMSLK